MIPGHALAEHPSAQFRRYSVQNPKLRPKCALGLRYRALAATHIVRTISKRPAMGTQSGRGAFIIFPVIR